jgi:hypothetical protein
MHFGVRKRLENRTWSTPHRGRLWIHAAARVNYGCPAGIARTLPPVETLSRSAILGCVQIIDCLPLKKLAGGFGGC